MRAGIINREADVADRIAIVGSGIVGLAHALAAAERGNRVRVFERDAAPRWASVRNFGMVWPIGLPPGERLETALESRELWRRVVRDLGCWHRESGAMFVATSALEHAVLEEFNESSPSLGYTTSLRTPAEVREACPLIRADRVRAGLISRTELAVDPREVMAGLPGLLAERFGVEFEFETAIVRASGSMVETASGARHEADRVIIASGPETRTLRPEVFEWLGLRTCTLQMLRVVPPTGSPGLAVHLAGGLTLRHYQSFADCPSLPLLREEVAARDERLDALGIHVLAAEMPDGSITLGDSHEYRPEAGVFAREEIDRLILGELGRFLNTDGFGVAERWLGRYLREEGGFARIVECDDGLLISQVTGGMGMTISFGVAQRFWEGRLESETLPVPETAS